MIDQATRTAAEQFVADIQTALRTTLESMLRAGAPQLEAIAEALGADVDPAYRARVLEALRDVHREGGI